MSDLALITKDDLNKSGQLTLNEAQLNLVLAKTPAKYVQQRDLAIDIYGDFEES